MFTGTVLMAFVRQPMTLPDGQQFFVLELRATDGLEHNLFSRAQPDILGQTVSRWCLPPSLGRVRGSRLTITAG
jgi:hypothetical protein